jgi:hypothetical protein
MPWLAKALTLDSASSGLLLVMHLQACGDDETGFAQSPNEGRGRGGL